MKTEFIVIHRETGKFLGIDHELHSEYPDAAIYSTRNVAHNSARLHVDGVYDVVSTADYAAGVVS